MNIPVHLKHKPVIVSEEYDLIDGRFSQSTDAKGLSLGLAQWNDRGRVDISAKIWRHTGGKWSRQSEELPLHRVLDLAILICRTKRYFQERYRLDGENPHIDRIGLQGGAMNVDLGVGNDQLATDIELFDVCLHEDDEIISERLKVLADLLKELGIA